MDGRVGVGMLSGLLERCAIFLTQTWYLCNILQYNILQKKVHLKGKVASAAG